jgi:4-carboxymuconolactone decarboxylase
MSSKEAKAQFEHVFGEAGKKVLERIAPLSPRFVAYVEDHIAADLYQDGTLDLRTRELCVIACLAAQGGLNEQLRVHYKTALRHGVRKEEIVAVLETINAYAGAPRAINAFFALEEVLAELAR